MSKMPEHLREVPRPDPRPSVKHLILRLLKSYLIVLGVMVLITGGIGLYGKGWEGALNGAIMGAMLSLFALPFIGIMINASYWSNFAGRWGESQYKKMLEGEPKDKIRD